MSVKEAISKTTIANIVSGIIVVGGLAYCIATGNSDGVMVICGAGLGYLFKTVNSG